MKEMKLNYKKTIYVGLAFFLISMFWQTYDNIIAKILIDKFGLSQTLSGLVMALDNILALFMLPLFGLLSDRTRTKLGKRTPFIIIGTLIASVAFVSLSFVDHSQTVKIREETTIIEDYKEINSQIENGMMTKNDWDVIFERIENERKESFDKEIISKSDYKKYETSIKQKYSTIIEEGDYSNSSTINRFDQREISDLFYNYLSMKAWELTRNDTKNLILFIVILLIVLVAMSTFRSPAVALMPDVTLKPLRSKGNAVINLMGAAGGILSIIIISAFGLSKESYVSYSPVFIATSVIMVISLLIFLWKVNENQLLQEYEEDIIKYGLIEDEDPETHHHILSSGEKKSLILILLSVFLWFTGYNAVISKLSDYAPKMLNMDFAIPLLVAQATAIVAFIPIGMLSSKFGRRKMILAGVLLLTICFGAAYFLNPETGWLLYVVLGLTGVAWATINVNSFPMVVELASGSDVGRYTGYYYAFSMAAQILTPILSGLLMDRLGRAILFPYAAVFVALSFITMFFVKHGDSQVERRGILESFDIED